MLPALTKFTLVSGHAEGETKLTAFDKALLDAGIGNLNLVRVSSILPPGARQVERLEVIPGSLLPTAYASITSDVPGERIAAAVAVGIASPHSYGVIMEYSGKVGGSEARATAERMVREAFAARGLEAREILVRVAEHVTEKTGCAFAAVALWS